MKTVYLSGPITGVSHDEARLSWRKEAFDALRFHGIVGFSPMRFKDHLKHVEKLSPHGDPSSIISCPRGLTTRDRFDTLRCDLLLVYVLGAEKISAGTMIEMGWADGARIPIVTVMEESGNPHDHAMVNELTGFRCISLESAIDVISAILTPGV